MPTMECSQSVKDRLHVYGSMVSDIGLCKMPSREEVAAKQIDTAIVMGE